LFLRLRARAVAHPQEGRVPPDHPRWGAPVITKVMLENHVCAEMFILGLVSRMRTVVYFSLLIECIPKDQGGAAEHGQKFRCQYGSIVATN
jgi:hypothetical protein